MKGAFLRRKRPLARALPRQSSRDHMYTRQSSRDHMYTRQSSRDHMYTKVTLHIQPLTSVHFT